MRDLLSLVYAVPQIEGDIEESITFKMGMLCFNPRSHRIDLFLFYIFVRVGRLSIIL